MAREVDPEEIAGMEMPCFCNCGNAFDLTDGNPCGGHCNNVYCTECVTEPWEQCPRCKEEDHD